MGLSSRHLGVTSDSDCVVKGHDESDIASSRHLNNKNDVDLDLFGCGTGVPLQDVVIGSLLGRGGFGKVYKGAPPCCFSECILSVT